MGDGGGRELRVGEPAPDFELAGIDGATGAACTHSLREHRGTPVVLAFYPADSSPVCTRQLVSYTAGIAELAALDAVLLAISPQDVASHRDFAAAHGGFAFPLLSDTDKAVGRSYGIVGLLDLYRRSTFIIDAEGVVAHAHRYLGPGLGYKPLAQIAGLVASIAG